MDATYQVRGAAVEIMISSYEAPYGRAYGRLKRDLAPFDVVMYPCPQVVVIVVYCDTVDEAYRTRDTAMQLLERSLHD